MLEDFRNHDPHPTREERAWMGANPMAAVGRLVLFIAVALIVGVGGSQLANPERPTTVAASHR